MVSEVMLLLMMSLLMLLLLRRMAVWKADTVVANVDVDAPPLYDRYTSV
jgi:hypothetical protein